MLDEVQKRLRGIAGTLLFALVAGCSPQISTAPATEDAPSAATGAFDPRDISGTWDRYPPPADAARLPSAVDIAEPEPIPPPPLKPEFRVAWEAEQKDIADAAARGQPIANHYTHCIPDGMPTMMAGMFPMEVLQTSRQTTIIQEAFNQVRRIYHDDAVPTIEDAEPRFWGHSAGHWEGNDFVVETVGIKEHVRFRGVPHSANLRIRERLRRIDADHFENEVVLEDPEYLTEPWRWKWIYQRRPNYKMYEYVCEDNREYADPETGEQRLRIDAE
ncbi:MAG: hypothetical protein IPG49_07885 [Proteobacteria bacterium]|nr:hypothetical protein [Pseudomonadota bacterium]